MQAVGTSHYFDDISKVASNRKGKSALVFLEVALALEDENEVDCNAVAVLHEGKKLAYLSRQYAIEFRKMLPNARYYRVTTAQAVITGGLVTSDRVYDYSLEIDIPDQPALSLKSAPLTTNIVRSERFPALVKRRDGSYAARVWIPTADRSDLDKSLEIGTWTTDEWRTVNFYVSERKRIGLGYKILEVGKKSYYRRFGMNEPEFKLEFIGQRFALLKVSPR